MRECPQCGNSYPSSFQYCPTDGTPLGGEAEENARKPARKPAQIKIKTLILGIVLLVVTAVLAFMGAFFYQYWKPKYGSLVIKTTPPGAMISVDGKFRGVSPITLTDMRSGSHLLRVTKEGYREYVQQVTVIPYATESVHWKL